MITDADTKLQRSLVGYAIERQSGRDAIRLLPDAWFTDHIARLARHTLNASKTTDRMSFVTHICADANLHQQLGQYIPDLTADGISATNLPFLTEQLRAAFIRHNVECFTDTVALATAPGLLPEERLDLLETKLTELRQASQPAESRYAHIKAGVAEAIADITEAQTAIAAGGKTRSIPTGIDALDAALFGGGFHPGQHVVVGARPGVGKSSFMVVCGRNQAKAGWKVGIISLEMSRRHLAEIGAQIAADMSFANLYRREITQHDLGRAMAGLEDIGGCEIYVDDSSALNADQVASRISHMTRVEGCQVVYVDYAQKIRRNNSRDVVAELGLISNRLTQCAKELNIPVISLAQVNRAASNTVPELQHLKGCSEFEQDAHIVLLLHRPEAAEERIDVEQFEIHLAKQRRGIANIRIQARFDRTTQAIY